MDYTGELLNRLRLVGGHELAKCWNADSNVVTSSSNQKIKSMISGNACNWLLVCDTESPPPPEGLWNYSRLKNGKLIYYTVSLCYNVFAYEGNNYEGIVYLGNSAHLLPLIYYTKQQDGLFYTIIPNKTFVQFQNLAKVNTDVVGVDTEKAMIVMCGETDLMSLLSCPNVSQKIKIATSLWVLYPFARENLQSDADMIFFSTFIDYHTGNFTSRDILTDPPTSSQIVSLLSSVVLGYAYGVDKNFLRQTHKRMTALCISEGITVPSEDEYNQIVTRAGIKPTAACGYLNMMYGAVIGINKDMVYDPDVSVHDQFPPDPWALYWRGRQLSFQFHQYL